MIKRNRDIFLLHKYWKETTGFIPQINLWVFALRFYKKGIEIANYSIKENNDDFDLEIEYNDLQTGRNRVTSGFKPRAIIRGIKNLEDLNITIDDYSETSPKFSIRTKVFAVQEIEIEQASIQLPKTGKITNILRCNDFDIDSFICKNWEITDIHFAEYDGYIEFNVNHFSAYAGAEIIATNASHLDENYSFISNIYDSVKSKDDIWSEPIYEGEIVRVTFEKELTNRRVIDVNVRSNGTIAYFDIYEAGTDNKVGRSGTTDYQEHQYMEVNNLTKPTDTFDFKVVKVYPDPEDDSTDIDANKRSFLEFDYIHDNAINSTQADGLIVYNELNIASPRYRTWNSSNNFSAELTGLSLGTGGTDDITWVVTKANHERDEFIVGTEDKSNDVNIQIFNSTKSFGNLLEVSTDVPNSAYRSFDIGIEDVSGDVLIVYENSSVADNSIYYRIWNGTYSSVNQLNTGLGSSAINWIKLVPRSGSDDMMLLISSAGSGLHAIPWDGTSFDTSSKNFTLTSSLVSVARQTFDFAWESSSRQGLALYGSGTDLVFRTYQSTAPYWSTEATMAALGGNSLEGLRVCSDPNSDYIGMIFQVSNTKSVSAMMWDGTTNLSGPPTADGTTETAGTNNVNVDCAWFNSTSALFGFDDVSTGSNGLLSMDYFTFTKSNSWSVSALTSAPTTTTFATDDIDGLRFAKHPTTNEIMITAMDIAEDISLIRWNGTNFSTVGESPVETNTEVLNGDQEGVMFDWDRYDTVPNVTSIKPASGTFSAGQTIPINATVTDNINVSSVFANITLPNGSISQISLLDTNSDTIYNSTFTIPNIPGTYILRIIANDTSTHLNYNSSETTTFTVSDLIFPNVFALIPAANSVFNVSNIIEIAANATDNFAVSFVYANITYPNGTKNQLTLSNVVGNKYNNSFTIPGLTGVYNVSYFANDSINNINSSERSNFTVNDVTKPNVSSLIPAISSSYNISNVIEISLNASDDVRVNYTYANISYPNGTITQLALNLATGNKYNNSFTIPALIGLYNISYFANDSSNNINSSERSNFTATENTIPVIAIGTCNPNPANISQTVICNATITDNIAVNNVTANVTYPNGSVQTASITNSSSIFNITFTNTVIPGQYNITWWANDTSNNIKTNTTNFVVNDVTKPNVTALRPINNSAYNVSNIIEISLNASDDVRVNYTYANISYPNGTITQLALNLATGNKYNNSFTIPALIGLYNISYFANDSSNNINSSERSNFTVYDVVRPTVTSLIPSSSSSYNVSNIIEIALNSTDDVRVNYTYANISYPNGTITQLALNLATGNKYNSSFTIPALIGLYNISYFANDSSNNINSSERSNFTVYDVVMPNVTITDPIVGSTYSQNANIILNVSVVDDINVSLVYANITLPDSSLIQKNLFDDDGDHYYNATFNTTSQTGTYTIRIIANDTSNNVNNTETRTFVVQDTGTPVSVLVSPQHNSILGYRNVNVTCNSTDNSGLSNITIYHNVTGLFSANQTQNITGTINQTNFTINGLNDGNYKWNCLVYANSGNSVFAPSNFTFIIDTTNPSVTNINPSINSVYNVSNIINLNITVTDANSLSTVYATIYYPNGTIQNLSLTDPNLDTIYTGVFTIPNIIGVYNITYFANDSSNNINSSERSNFTAYDYVAPSISIIGCYPSSPNISQLVSCNSTISDNVQLNTILANVTLPNGTVQQQTVTNTSSIYNFTFTLTTTVGTYSVIWFANDTSNNKNTNTTTFTVSDVVNPSVTSLIPSSSSSYNVSNIIEIALNSTDDVRVNYTYANISYPNGTITQLALNLATGNKYNNSFTIPNIIGLYNITYFANDSSNNINSSERSNFTVYDVVIPNVTSLIPSLSSSYNVSNTIEIAATITDDVSVSSAYANITYPNTTRTQITLSLTGSNKYNNSFTIPALIGIYNITYFANDSSNNINSSERSNFTVSELVPPTINILGCNVSNINLSQTIQCNATITDDISLDSVKANITSSNGSVLVQVLGNVSSNYHFNFSDTNNAVGQYNILWWANDSAGNIRANTSNFNISDVTKPGIYLTSPTNLSNHTSSVSFVFNATDNFYSNLSCSVIIDNSIAQSNPSTITGTSTTLTVSSLSNGDHNWSINCSDGSSNLNSSETRTFRVDTYAPSFISLTTTPSSTDDLDPNINITAFANVTDNLTQVNTVLLQYKLSTDTTYTNISMIYNIDSGLYNATFNATSNGTYNLRLFANDSVGNSDYSNYVNLSVQYERTWTREPSVFTPVSSTLNSNVSLGNLTLNNTGDYEMNFTITSNSNYTIYNESFPLSIAAKAVKTIAVNDNATSAGVKTVTLTINATPDGNPSSLTTTGTIVNSPGQPIVSTTFLTPSSDSLSVTQGQTNVQLIAKIENLGEADAYNVTFYFDIPNNWQVTFGSKNITINTLSSGDSQENTIEVNIPSNEEIGYKIININATGYNGSGNNIKDLNLLFGDSINVTVNAQATTLGSGTSSGGTAAPAAGTSSGGGGTSGGKVTKSGGETVYTTESMTVLRGTKEGAQTKIKNNYENAIFENIKFEVTGFLSQYIKLTPIIDPTKLVWVETKELVLNEKQVPQLVLLGSEEHHIKLNKLGLGSADFTFSSDPIDLTLTIGETENLDTNKDRIKDTAITLKNISNGNVTVKVHKLGPPDPNRIYFNEERDYSIGIFVPPYLQKETLKLNVKITATLLPVNPELAGFTYKNFTEYRIITLNIIEVNQTTANTNLDQARKDVNDMIESNIPSSKAKDLLAKAESAFNESDYESVLKLVESISKIKKEAFEANNLIKEVQQGIENAKQRWLKTTETEKILSLALKAFEREDFESALERIKNAQLVLALETKGKTNIFWFIKNYWWQIILSIIVIFILALIIYIKTIKYIVSYRMNKLAIEESSIRDLLKEAQSDYMTKKTITALEYHKLMLGYESRLTKIGQIRAKLRNKRVRLFSKEQELENIEREKNDVIELIKKAQEDYYKKGELTREKFMEISDSDRVRLAEIEEQKAVIEQDMENKSKEKKRGKR